MAILAKAEADRIRLLDQAMANASHTTQQRELVRASAEALGATQTSLILASSMADTSSLLSGNIPRLLDPSRAFSATVQE